MSIHIHETAQENAMTEIALALAMGFFSLMVLTLISMGAGETANAKSQTIVLAPLADKDATGASRIETNDLIIIFDGERFLDIAMKEIDPKAAVSAMTDPGSRVVLALDPKLPLDRAIKARALVSAENLVVSSLDEQWLKALSSKRRGK